MKNSVFHRGEIEVQTRVGVVERVSQIGPRMVREYMPDQHREFYQQLPFILIGYQDAGGQVWASIVTGKPGFIESPSPTSLSLRATPLAGDHLSALLEHAAKNGESKPRVGLLGIELTSKRRNRINGEISSVTKEGFGIEVTQTFGNCPKYINVRKVDTIDTDKMASPSVTDITSLTQANSEMISLSDTFFIASSNQERNAISSKSTFDGADVSHRGGKPGFVRVDNQTTLTIPDYSGNNVFNTLGNISVNPNIGLLFINFENGDVLSLTGQAEILWDSPEQQQFDGAQRLWRFTLSHGRLMQNALALRFSVENE